MKPLIVLITAFLLGLAAMWLFGWGGGYKLAMRIGMSGMLLFTAMGHFAFTKGMMMMLPNIVPYKKALVYITGFIEIVAAIGLLAPGYEKITGWALIVFFILILPANIYAAVKNVNYQTGTYNGAGRNYLWFRVPLQVLFIAWTHISIN
ncbi:hypothetical protein EOD41_01935 [Mucilaginibacter limnophilus]|uniref:DoxX family membrane protein n=1 Tax=Mucilaginibacter limnophilus TaxID=1932778 RepID=A0A437MYH9_9SPHI|nr:hypothetical protein [Mucilaginibacter limnophilus]RVU02724.1 hypothetical protein EOD41_01935 [Mucilaginibacter limnophilus]